MPTGTGARRPRGSKPSKLVPMKDNGRGYAVGFVRIGGVVFQLDPSPSSTDGVMGWLKITKLRGPKGGGYRRRSTSGGGYRTRKRATTRRTTTRRRTSRRPARSGGAF